MNMNYIYLTTISRSILTKVCVFLVLFTIFHFDLEKFISKNCKYVFFYQKFVHLCENTSVGFKATGFSLCNFEAVMFPCFDMA